MERTLCSFGIYLLWLIFLFAWGLVHVVPDVPKDINEYIDSEGEGELVDRDLLFYHGTTMDRTMV